jgi:hypothetical protein
LYENLLHLAHKNIPQIFQVVSLRDSFYIIEEYIKGKTLYDTFMQNSVLENDAVTSILAQLCDVLSFLHTQPTPIIHRDITPSNVILTPTGIVKLLDFDIAREYKTNAPMDTEIVGTKFFAPPEQYGFAQSDCRADIYALGILTTYLLTGDYNPQKINDTHLRKIAKRCTAFAPEKRYRNAEKLRRAVFKKDRKPWAVGVCASLVILVLILAMYRFSRVGEAAENKSMENETLRMVTTLHAAQDIYAIAPGGLVTLWVYAYDQYGERFTTEDEKIHWAINHTSPYDVIEYANEMYQHTMHLSAANHLHTRLIEITASSESDPSVYYVFQINVSANNPHINLHWFAASFYSGEPETFYIPISVRNIDDGIYKARFRVTDTPALEHAFSVINYNEPLDRNGWFAFELEIINGEGFIPLAFDGLAEAMQINMHYQIALEIPAVGLLTQRGWRDVRINERFRYPKEAPFIYLNYNDDDENVPLNQRNTIWFYNPEWENASCAVYVNGVVQLHHYDRTNAVIIIDLHVLLLEPGIHDITVRFLNPENVDEVISEHSNAVRITIPNLPREAAPALTVVGNILLWDATSPVDMFWVYAIPVDPSIATIGYARFVHTQNYFDLSQMRNIVPGVRYYVHVMVIGDLINTMHSNNSNQITFMLE